MEMPEDVLNAVRESCEEYPDDLDKALGAAKKAVRGLPDFKKLIDLLVDDSIQDLVYSFRHQANVAYRNSMGRPEGLPKVVSGASAAVNAAATSVYQYFIAGTTLGQVMGSQLEAIAGSEQSMADTHSFHARLCRRLVQIVPKSKMVREAVKEKRLERIFRDVQKSIENDVP